MSITKCYSYALFQSDLPDEILAMDDDYDEIDNSEQYFATSVVSSLPSNGGISVSYFQCCNGDLITFLDYCLFLLTVLYFSHFLFIVLRNGVF